MMVKMLRRLFLWSFLSLFSMISAASAAESAWKDADHIKIRLLADRSQVAKGGPVRGGINLQLAPGWHAYWRTPGESGLAPVFDWTGSENADGFQVLWPVPRRIGPEGVNSFGYDRSLLIPFSFRQPDLKQESVVHLKADIMVCNMVCVPQSVTLEMTVPETENADSLSGGMIERAMDGVPQGSVSGIRIKSVVLGPKAAAVTVYLKRGFRKADIFPETDADFTLAAPPELEKTGGEGGREAILRIPAPAGIDNLASALAGHKLVLTLTDGENAVEQQFSF